MLATFPFEKKTLKFVTGKYKSRSRTEKLCEEAALLHAPNFEMYQLFNTELENTKIWKRLWISNTAFGGEISSDLYRFVQCDIKKCAFDSLKLEQNPQNCD